MLIGRGETIPSNKIMLPKHQALAKAWNASKQDDWGELTNIAILITSNMIKNNQFKSMNELYIHMANLRTLIGVILGHSPDVGKIGRGMAMTPITNHPDSGYKEMHPEFKSWVESLRAEKNNENVSVSEDESGEVTLKGKLKHPDSADELEYTRSTILGKDKFSIHHSQDQAALMRQANRMFVQLHQEGLNSTEKQKCIESIFYYIADAMPCARGAGAIAQMIFYALEDAHVGKMRYLGKMASQFGHEQGVTPDIAAMLSPNLSDFQNYFKKYVVEKDIVVTKHTPTFDLPLTAHSQLVADIKNTKEALERFQKTLNYTGFTNAQQLTIEPMLRAYDFLSGIVENLSEHSEQLEPLQIMLKKLKDTMALNQVCYPQFYNLLDSKEGWPEQTPKAYINVPDVTEDSTRDQYLSSIRSTISVIHNYCSSLGYLYGWNSDTHHVATHYTAKNISGISESFKSNRAQGSLDINQYLATCEFFINQQKSGFGNGIDEIAEILSIIDKDKDNAVLETQTLDKIYSQICEKIKEPSEKVWNEYHVKAVKDNIANIYKDSEQIKKDLQSLAPLSDVLNIKNTQASDLINAGNKKQIDTKPKLT